MHEYHNMKVGSRKTQRGGGRMGKERESERERASGRGEGGLYRENITLLQFHRNFIRL